MHIGATRSNILAAHEYPPGWTAAHELEYVSQHLHAADEHIAKLTKELARYRRLLDSAYSGQSSSSDMQPVQPVQPAAVRLLHL